MISKEEDYNFLFEQAGDAIFVVGFDECIIDVNTGAEELLGYERHEFIGMNMKELVDPRELSKEPLHTDKLVRGEHVLRKRTARRKDGSALEVEVNNKSIGNERILIIVKDLTALAEITRQKDLSENIFSTAFDSSPLGMALVSAEGRFIKVNKALCRILGYSELELLVKSFAEVSHPDDLNSGLEFVQQANEGKTENFRIEKRYFHKTGRIIWASLNSGAVRDKDGKILFFATQIEDITEKRKSAEQLQKRESELTALLDNLDGAASLLDDKRKYVLYNQKFIHDHYLMTKRNPVPGLRVYEYFPEEIQKTRHELIDRVMKGSKEVIETDYINDGRRVWFRTSFNPVVTNGKVTGVSTYAIDLTDIRQKEIDIREAEEKFRNLVESAQIGVYILQNRKFVYVNPSFCRIFGYAEQEVVNKIGVDDLVIPEDIEIVNEALDARKDGTTEFVNYEVRTQTIDGRQRWIEIFGSSTVYKGAPAYIGTFADITERRESTATILREKIFSESIIKGLPGIFYMTDAEGKFLRWNTNLELITGLSPAQLAASVTADVVEPEYRELVHIKRKELRETGKASAEVVLKSKDGKKHFFYFSAIRTEDKMTEQYVGIGTDVTEQRETQAALRKTTYDIGERVKELRCLYQLSEVSNDPQRTLNDVMQFCANIIPPAYQYPEITCSRITFNDAVYLSPVFTESKWSQVAPIQVNHKPVGKVEVFYTEKKAEDFEGPFLKEERDLINSIAEVLGSTAEKKIAMETLTESEEKYRYLFNNNPAVIIIWDHEKLKILEVNQQAVDLYGYSREEFVGMSILEYRPPEDHERILDLAKRMHENVPAERTVWRHLKKSGELMYMDITFHKMFYNDRNAVLALAKDVTEQFKAEEALRKTNEDISQLNTHLQTIREEERTRIARELHDELGQQLTGLKMYVSSLMKKVLEKDDALRNKTEEITSFIDDTVRSVHRISSDLGSGILDDLGLVPTLEWQSGEFEKRTGVMCTNEFALKRTDIDPEIATAVFRIFQEALTNVMRYSGANAVKTKLTDVEDELLMLVKDNGIGFDTAAKGKKTLGLIGMRERARALGGNVEIKSKPGDGTEVHVRIPLLKKTLIENGSTGHR